MENHKDGLVASLVARYGTAVLVHTQYHVQVETPVGKHDVWVNRRNEITYSLAGTRDVTKGVGLTNLLKALSKWDASHTDLAKMQNAMAVTQAINRAVMLRQELKADTVVFTDAGWKPPSHGRISMILIDGEHVKAEAFPIVVKSISAAEYEAVCGGLKLHPTCPVYTDSEGTAHAFKKKTTRVQWISRTQNKAADGLANLRGRKVVVPEQEVYWPKSAWFFTGFPSFQKGKGHGKADR